MVMVNKAKTRDKSTEKSNVNDIVRAITDVLWSYDSVRRVVNNNYIILQSVVRNVVKSLGINADNFDIESFGDNFDIHELDLESQDTLMDSLAKVLSKFVIHNDYDKVDIAMEKAPYEIANRLSEVLKYLKENPGDSETIEYAKELINQLRGFDWSLALRYESELSTILNPKPVEPKPEQPKPDNEPKAKVKVIPKSQVDDNVARIEGLIKHYLLYVRAPVTGPYYVERVRELIEKLRKVNLQKASEYERKLNTILYEKRKYANYGKKEPRTKVRIRRASAKITEYLNANESERESDKRELVIDTNAVDVSEILRPMPRPARPVRNNVVTVKQKHGLLYQIRKIANTIGKDFVNMYYYRRRY